MKAKRTSAPWRALISACVTSALLSGLAPAPAAAETETGPPEFGVIYTANAANHGDDLDCWIIHDAFLAAGWQQNFFKTSMSGAHSNHPDHTTFTHGPNDDNTGAAGDAVDLLYVSGHGWDHAKLPIFDSTSSHDALPPDSISPDTNCTNDSPWEVGVGWIERNVAARTGYNESRWDTDIEWLMLCACDQLSNAPADTYPVPNPTNSSAKTWARTLLGGPNRMHGILGYAGTAPGTVDDEIAYDFGRRSLQPGTGAQTVLGAWERANAPYYNYDWAAVVHDANVKDYLPPAGPMTPDTTYNGWFGIDYYSRRLDGRILDGRGGAAETLSEAPVRDGSSWLARAIGAVSGAVSAALGTPEAHAAQGARRIAGRDLTLDVPATVRACEARLAPRCARIATATLESVLPERSSRPVPVPASGAGIRPVSVRRSVSTSEVVTVWSNGRSEYDAGRPVDARPMGRSRDEAVSEATAFLAAHGELPANAVAGEVRAVTRTRLGLEQDDDATETLRYEVHFAQRDGAAFIEGADAGITVVVDREGVARVSKRWIELLGETEAAQTPVTADAALRSAAADARRAVDATGRHDVHAVDVVYHLPAATSGGGVSPAWRIELEDGSCMFVDAQKGSVIAR
ncbi:MAG: hypothetical protein FDZ70_01840 [Actinobacteria bacterium]|nr:MAG: hypothetical protein FDZ70_01840 [Actinomycetota bacterium]